MRVPSSSRTLCAPSTGVGSDAWAGSARPRPRRAGAVPEPASLAGGPPVPVGQAARRVCRTAKAAVSLGRARPQRPLSTWALCRFRPGGPNI
jgi:hypothetical protein